MVEVREPIRNPPYVESVERGLALGLVLGIMTPDRPEKAEVRPMQLRAFGGIWGSIPMGAFGKDYCCRKNFI
jgi:hypothetical protein